MLNKRISLLLILTLVILTLCSCTQKEKIKYYETYGGAKAVTKHYLGYSVTYKVMIQQDDEYAVAASEALATASAALRSITGISIKQITSINPATSDFMITKEMSSGSYNAKNNITTDKTNRVTASKIVYNVSNMSNLSNDGKVHVALHELGHTIGLKDLINASGDKYSNFENYSVMYYMYNNSSKYTFKEFQEFDLQNIKYIYGKE